MTKLINRTHLIRVVKTLLSFCKIKAFPMEGFSRRKGNPTYNLKPGITTQNQQPEESKATKRQNFLHILCFFYTFVGDFVSYDRRTDYKGIGPHLSRNEDGTPFVQGFLKRNAKDREY